MTDLVNHPAHYTEHPSGIECIQITEHMGFNLGNAVKYIWRADLKGSAIEDLEKARWYINRELTKRDALFPATEPAEVISRYQTMQRGFAAKHFGFPANPVFEDRYTAPDGGKWQWTDELQWELRCYPPAPAVPAGEETKAEPSTRQIADVIVEGRSQNMSWMQIAEMVKQVFFPTETGPWPTWQEVPEGVQYYGINGWGPTYYVNRGGVRYRVFDDTPSKTADYVVQNFAPFVAAAEEG